MNRENKQESKQHARLRYLDSMGIPDEEETINYQQPTTTLKQHYRHYMNSLVNLKKNHPEEMNQVNKIYYDRLPAANKITQALN